MTHATISKEFTFSAAHHLEGLDPSHPCSRVHGHNYVVRVTIPGLTDDTGFVIDYRSLGWLSTWLDATFDHRDLNDVVTFNPTAENLAGYILGIVLDWVQTLPNGIRSRLDLAISVAVSETPKTWATVTR